MSPVDPTFSLTEMLNTRTMNKQLREQLDADTSEVDHVIGIALSEGQPEGWRAAWLLKSVLQTNDVRLSRQMDRLIRVLSNRPDGHQRELLRLIEKYTLTDEQEGVLFDVCLEIWTSIHKSSSVRITALKQLAAIIGKYPELVHEVWHLIEDVYGATLSPGIRNQFKRLRASLDVLVSQG